MFLFGSVVSVLVIFGSMFFSIVLELFVVVCVFSVENLLMSLVSIGSSLWLIFSCWNMLSLVVW